VLDVNYGGRHPLDGNIVSGWITSSIADVDENGLYWLSGGGW